MKKITSYTLILVIALLNIQCKSKQEKEPLAKRVVVLGFDGFSVDGFKKAHHPNLDSLFLNGVLSLSTRAVMPSVTLPNWTSHMTGSGPEQHGVDNNNWKIDDHVLDGVMLDNKGYYPSIFKVLKDELPNSKTAYYYNWGNLINPINQDYLDEVNFLENDEYVENYNKAFEFIKNNQANPSLIFLYTVHTDHSGHQFQWMSQEYITSLEEADIQVGKLINNLKENQLFSDTHFILITDHGGKGFGHGGMTPVEMNVPWAISGPGIAKGKILNVPNNNTNTAVVIADLFGLKQRPASWIGQTPQEIYK